MAQSAPTPDAAPPVTDPGAQRVAGVYAKALLAAADKAGVAEATVDDLEAIDREVLERFPRLVTVLASGFVNADEKRQIVDRTFAGRVSPLVLNFLRVLAQHERLDALRDIARAAREQYDVMRGLVRVEVTTATTLTDELAAKIKEQLRGMLGGEPVLMTSIKPELIGGVVLRVGDAVYDGSVAARLADVRGRIINRSVHEIQSRRDSFSHPAGN
ncbi:MAG TPA: ATP synthase F1 subunit delta [Pirellulales bacterium]